mmetsp:Transcript_11845/g.28314  ORF Transcript_11845/g.28314 Transcript_11845/m.28314 type:complete len:229 (+) Transcript_11845:2632-3318(+)
MTSVLLPAPFSWAMTWSNIFWALSSVELKSSRPFVTLSPNWRIHLPTCSNAGLIFSNNMCRPFSTSSITTSITSWIALITIGTRASTCDEFLPCTSCNNINPCSGPCCCNNDSSGCFDMASSVSLPTMDRTTSSWDCAPMTCSKLVRSIVETLFIFSSISVFNAPAMPLPTLAQPLVECPTSTRASDVHLLPSRIIALNTTVLTTRKRVHHGTDGVVKPAMTNADWGC